MVITFAGTNSFGLQAALQARVGQFTAEYGDMSLERLDGEEASYERLQEAVTSLPFLATQKLVVLKKPSANKTFIQNYEALLREVPETTTLILVEPKPDKRSSYYKFIKKSTDYQEFNELDARGLASWLTKQAAERGGALSQGDAAYLVDRVGPQQQLLAGELGKLLLYNSKVSRDSINELTERTPASTIFELIESAFSGNLKRTMQLYDEQRLMKVEPQQIIAMLTWQLHILALVKTAEQRSPQAIASEAKLSPYVVQKSVIVARKISGPRIKQLLDELLTLDLRLKRESLNADDAVASYLLQLAQ